MFWYDTLEIIYFTILNVVYEYIQNATNGTYKLIGDKFRANPQNMMYRFDRDEVKSRLMNGSLAHIHVL